MTVKERGSRKVDKAEALNENAKESNAEQFFSSKTDSMTTLCMCVGNCLSRCIGRVESQLKVGLIRGLAIHTLVYLQPREMQDLLQHNLDRRSWWALAILDHVFGKSHPWGTPGVMLSR